MDDVVEIRVSRAALKRGLVAVGLVTVGYLAGVAHAAVPADADALNYRGYLVENGTPVNGARPVAVEIYNEDAVGTGTALCRADPPGDTTVSAGWFTIPLGAECAADLRGPGPFFVDVQVSGATVGQRQRLGAVPFALEAGTAATAAALTPRTAVRGSRTTLLTINSGDAVPFEEQLDVLNEYNPTTGVFTATHAGIYWVECTVGFNSQVDANYSLDLDTANVITAQVWRGGPGGAIQLQVQSAVSLMAGETVLCRANVSTGGMLDVAGSAPWDTARNHFSIVRVD